MVRFGLTNNIFPCGRGCHVQPGRCLSFSFQQQSGGDVCTIVTSFASFPCPTEECAIGTSAMRKRKPKDWDSIRDEDLAYHVYRQREKNANLRRRRSGRPKFPPAKQRKARTPPEVDPQETRLYYTSKAVSLRQSLKKHGLKPQQCAMEKVWKKQLVMWEMKRQAMLKQGRIMQSDDLDFDLPNFLNRLDDLRTLTKEELTEVVRAYERMELILEMETWDDGAYRMKKKRELVEIAVKGLWERMHGNGAEVASDGSDAIRPPTIATANGGGKDQYRTSNDDRSPDYWDPLFPIDETLARSIYDLPDDDLFIDGI